MTEKEFIENLNESKGIVYRVCNTYCNSYSREDLVQEIILEAFKSINNFKNNCKFSTWLYTIAKNVCISNLRKEKKKPRIEGLDDYAEVLAESNNAPELVKQLREAMRYNTVLDTIDEAYQSVFEMHLHGISYNEISQQTGISENLLRQYIHRIKQRLYLRYGKSGDIT